MQERSSQACRLRYAYRKRLSLHIVMYHRDGSDAAPFPQNVILCYIFGCKGTYNSDVGMRINVKLDT